MKVMNYDEAMERIDSLEKQLGEAQAEIDACRKTPGFEDGPISSRLELFTTWYKIQIKTLTERTDVLQSKVRAFEEAMERERKPDWIKSHLELAQWLEDTAQLATGAVPKERLSTAATELRYMAESFTLKANFVPSNLRIQELESQLSGVQMWLKSQGMQYEFPKVDLWFPLTLRVKELEAQLQQLSGWRERLIKVLDVDLCEWMRKEGYSAGFAEMKKNDLLELL